MSDRPWQEWWQGVQALIGLLFVAGLIGWAVAAVFFVLWLRGR